MTDSKIQNLVSGAIAVMFGFVAYKIIQTQLLRKSGDFSLSEPTSSATGYGQGKIYPNPCRSGREAECADLCRRSGGVMKDGFCVQPSRRAGAVVSAKRTMRSFF